MKNYFIRNGKDYLILNLQGAKELVSPLLLPALEAMWAQIFNDAGVGLEGTEDRDCFLDSFAATTQRDVFMVRQRGIANTYDINLSQLYIVQDAGAKIQGAPDFFVRMFSEYAERWLTEQLEATKALVASTSFETR